MIRTLLLLALTCTAFAAEMVHQRVVMKGGEELVGWWCADQGVLYLDNGKRKLVDKPADQVAKVEPAPTGDAAPARKQFKAPADLPYGRLVLADERVYVGWWDEEDGTLFREDGTVMGVMEGRTFQPTADSGEKMPDAAAAHVRRKAVEQD